MLHRHKWSEWRYNEDFPFTSIMRACMKCGKIEHYIIWEDDDNLAIWRRLKLYDWPSRFPRPREK